MEAPQGPAIAAQYTGDNAQFANHDDGAQGPRPKFAWSYIAVMHPKITTAVLLVIPIICAALIFGLGAFSLAPFELEDFFVRTDIKTREFHSHRAVLNAYPFDLSDRRGTPERSVVFRKNSLVLVLRSTRPNTENPYLPAVYSKTTTTGNVLTPEGLAMMRKAEKTILALQDYTLYCYNDGSTDCGDRPRRCALPLSVTLSPAAYGRWDNDTGKLCGFASEKIAPVSIRRFGLFQGTFFPKSFVNQNSAATQEFFRQAGIDITEVPLDKLEKLRLALGSDFSESNPTSQLMRSVIRMGSPVGNLSPDQLVDEFRKWVKDKVTPAISKLNTAKFHVQAVSLSLVRPLIESAVKRDAMFALGSVALVFIVVAIHTGSFFLALITLFQILLSFPLTFVVYRYIFQVKYFGVLNVTTLFLLLGIGADDVFVFTDTWHQAGEKLGPDCAIIDRMIFTYRRAVKAMTLTTFTTSIAFLITMTSPIMPINTLGSWAAMLVVVQFLLVITIYPCALIIHHQFAGRFKKIGKKKTDGDEEDAQKTAQPNITSSPSAIRAVVSVRSLLAGVDEHGQEFRPIEKFFNGKWTNLMQKLRFPLIAVALILLGVSVYFAALLQPPVEQEQILPKSDPMYSALLLQQSAFPALDDSNGVLVNVVFGVKESNRSGISRFNATAPGKAVLDTKFSLRTAAAQQRLLEACTFFEKIGTNDTERMKAINQCWVKDFAEWRTKEKINNTNTNRSPFVSYANESAFAKEVLEFGKFEDGKSRPYLKYLESGRVGMTARQDQVIFTQLSFATDLVPFGPVSKARAAYTKWENALKEFNTSTRVDALKRPFASGGQSWAWMETQKALKDSAVSGLGIMLAIAFVSLTLATGNVIVAFLALFCIAAIVVSILAVIQIIGWSYGIAESICIVVAVGFSFDYVAHLVAAYVESEHDDRVERTRDALTELGISVIAGATSTLLAGSMLFFARIVLLFKFGALVVVTIVISVIWSLAFLPAILLTIGPQGGTGSVRRLLPCLGKRTKSSQGDPVLAEELPHTMEQRSPL